MESKTHNYTFEVITRAGSKPQYQTVDIEAQTVTAGWDELRKAIDDSPLIDEEKVIAISLLSIDKGARQEPASV